MQYTPTINPFDKVRDKARDKVFSTTFIFSYRIGHYHIGTSKKTQPLPHNNRVSIVTIFRSAGNWFAHVY